jgi:cytochrome c oxidase assembly factor CtaG
VTLSILFTIFLAILGIYAIAMSRIADQLPPSRQRWHSVWFSLGLLVALTVLIPSPDLFGPDHRFTVNMGQLLLAVDLAPPLLFMGIPALMLQKFLRWEGMGRRLTAPHLVGFASAVILLGWFVPVSFEAASRSLPIWIFKQVVFLVAGLLLWWPVAGPLPALKPPYPVQLLYIFVTRLPMTVLGIILTLADKLIYSARSFALELCAPSSLPDQQVGGLVMWVLGGLIMFAAFSIVFFRWFSGPEAAESEEF